MKHLIRIMFAMCATFALFTNCNNVNYTTTNSDNLFSFWGDSVCTIQLAKPQNGYKISFFIMKDRLSLAHFERGDSIDRLVSLHTIPYELHYYFDSVGTYNVDYDIPIMQLDTLRKGPYFLFMDVNFDGEEDFLVRSEGYNRDYYVCFDLVNGNRDGSCPGLLECLSKPPYDNIVCGGMGDTYFDFSKKSIRIIEQMGCCGIYETLARLTDDPYSDERKEVKVVKMIEKEYGDDGCHIIVKEPVNDTLRVVENKFVPHGQKSTE